MAAVVNPVLPTQSYEGFPSYPVITKQTGISGETKLTR